MSGRCKACDKKLQEHEIVRKIKSPLTGLVQYTDLCSHCLNDEELKFLPPQLPNFLEVDDE
jgi:hypothetical protein